MKADLFWIGEERNANSNLRSFVRFLISQTWDLDIMTMLCIDMDRTNSHKATRDFDLSRDGHLMRYREGYGPPMAYASSIAMDSRLLDDASAGTFNLNIYFDRATENAGCSDFR